MHHVCRKQFRFRRPAAGKENHTKKGDSTARTTTLQRSRCGRTRRWGCLWQHRRRGTWFRYMSRPGRSRPGTGRVLLGPGVEVVRGPGLRDGVFVQGRVGGLLVSILLFGVLPVSVVLIVLLVVLLVVVLAAVLLGVLLDVLQVKKRPFVFKHVRIAGLAFLARRRCLGQLFQDARL
jgi:hypothetical protein